MISVIPTNKHQIIDPDTYQRVTSITGECIKIYLISGISTRFK
jgi:hypothetical protein